jgi:hypothetical protein
MTKTMRAVAISDGRTTLVAMSVPWRCALPSSSRMDRIVGDKVFEEGVLARAPPPGRPSPRSVGRVRARRRIR